jgi:hypothetical protein
MAEIEQRLVLVLLIALSSDQMYLQNYRGRGASGPPLLGRTKIALNTIDYKILQLSLGFVNVDAPAVGYRTCQVYRVMHTTYRP